MQQRARSCSRPAIPFRLRNLRKRFRFRRSRCAATSRRSPQQGLVARVRGGVRALAARPVGGRLRPPAAPRGRAQARDRPRRGGARRRGRGGRARREHDRLLPRARAAREARARRRHERPARSRPRSPTRPASPCSSPAGCCACSAMSLVGDLGTDVLRTTRINKGFLGARGLSLERGLMDLNPDEVRIKQEMADACEQVYGILDGTKWHRSALLSFVPVERARTAIVTDSSAPADEVAAWRARGRRGDRGRSGPARAAARAAARPAPRRAQRRGRRLMPTMAAVDLGAQSGRVAVGPLRRRAARRSTRCTGSRTSPSRRGGRSTGTCSRLVRETCSTGLRAAARGGRSTRSASTRGPSTSALLDRAADSLVENPVHYRDPQRAAALADARPACLPRASCTSAPGSSCLPINTIFELAAMAARGRPGARDGRRRCC